MNAPELFSCNQLKHDLGGVNKSGAKGVAEPDESSLRKMHYLFTREELLLGFAVRSRKIV